MSEKEQNKEQIKKRKRKNKKSTINRNFIFVRLIFLSILIEI